MSESPMHVPQWDMADRMRKSLRDADLRVQDMAEYLEVNRNTVGNWINGRVTPPGTAIRLWAMRCGVPLKWLRHGDAGDPFGDDPGATIGRVTHRYSRASRARVSLAAVNDSVTGLDQNLNDIAA